VGYLIAAYAIAIVGIGGYGALLWKERRALLKALGSPGK
jgi:CcmD family protein